MLQKKFKITLNGEEFILKNHLARDLRRYDFLFDIYRLEQLKRNTKIDTGYAIFLTNDPNYWEIPKRNKKTNDFDFRIHEGRKIGANSVLKWSPNASKGTIKGREEPIRLINNYLFSWQDYSILNIEQNSKIAKPANRFRYLLVKV